MSTSSTLSKLGFVTVAAGAALFISAGSSRAQVLSLVRDNSGETFTSVQSTRAIDDAGTAAFGVCSSNQYGGNPKFRDQIFRWDPATGAGEQLTNFKDGVLDVSVSDDGQWLVFRSSGNLTGANADRSIEVFVMHPDGTGLAQLTNDASLSDMGPFSAVISGSGNRVVFVSDADPLGLNAGRLPQIFVVNRDGSNLVQLWPAGDPITRPAISDDGNRVVFTQEVSIPASATQVLTSPADGSSTPVVIATAAEYSSFATLSGDGSTIVLDQNNGSILKVNYDGTGLIASLAAGRIPTLTDDGATIFYLTSTGSIRKIGTDGTGDTLVATGTGSPGFSSPVISGDGTRLLVSILNGQPAGVVNPDNGRELLAMNGSGGDLHQLTSMTVAPVSPFEPRTVQNGGRIFFASTSNPTGGNADGSGEIFTLLANGTGLAQMTSQTGFGLGHFAVSDAGMVTYESGANPLDTNPCGTLQLFKINLNGTGLAQLTNNCPTGGLTRFPEVRFDGQIVVFLAVLNNVFGLYRVPTAGGAASLITTSNDSEIFDYSIGTVPITYIAYDSPNNNDGLNPTKKHQIARSTYTGGSYLRITADPVYGSDSASITGDGNLIAFQSAADLVGTNADHSGEIFLYTVSTGTMRQLTNNLGTGAYSPRITRDGAWVYFGVAGESLRISPVTNEIQRLTGILKNRYPSGDGVFDVDGTGARTFLSGTNTLDGGRTSGTSFFLADQNVQPKLYVGKADPTVLSWDPDPQSARFDVIRGNLASVAIAGGTVDLGPVTCLENDSLDADTVGNEDTMQPMAGQVFFYLYRGTVGYPAVTGSYGQGTGGRERLAGLGGCGS